MKQRRPLLFIASLFTLLVMILAACGGGGGSGGGGGGAINYSGTITIWHNWQGNYLAAKQAIFNAYHAMHPNVTINLVHQDTVVDKSITAVKANNGPDIIAWVDDSLGKLVLSNTIIPLDQYISADFINSTYNKAAAEGVQFKGHVWGVPESVEAITIMYNKALITADQLPKTTDDVLTFEQNYAKAHPKQYGLVWNTEDAYFNAPWFYGFGTAYVDNTGKVGLDNQQGIAAGHFIASLRPYLPSQISYDVASSLFTEGKAAAIINGPWSYSDYTTKAKIDVGFATLPVIPSTNTPAKPFVGVKSLWVTKNATNPALDVDLLKFYTNKANQIAQATANGEIPSNLAADNDPAVTSNPAVSGYAAQAQLGTALPNTPYMSGLWDPVAKALTAIWNGSQSVEDALKAAQAVAEKNVKDIQS